MRHLFYFNQRRFEFCLIEFLKRYLELLRKYREIFVYEYLETFYPRNKKIVEIFFETCQEFCN